MFNSDTKGQERVILEYRGRKASNREILKTKKIQEYFIKTEKPSYNRQR